MPILESPRCDSWPIPSLGPEPFGLCFLLRLDPAASVAALKDEEATQAASEVPRDWYLGIALSNGRTTLYSDDGMTFLNFKFGLVGVGLPDFPQASVPIAPATQLAPDRPPLQFIPPLPWNGLYVHTHHYVKAIISRIHYTIGERVATLSPEQNDKLRDDLLADEYNRVDLVRERQEALQQLVQEEPAASPDQPATTTSDNDLDRDLSSSTISGSECGSEISESEMKYYLREDMQDRFANVRLFVEVWSDPAALPELPTLADPAKFEEARARVQSIWKAWQERMLDETLAKRPQTNEWLRGIEQGDAVDVEEVVLDADALFDDDAISPEDALDARMEKENASRLYHRPTAPASSHHPETTKSSQPAVVEGSTHSVEPAAAVSPPPTKQNGSPNQDASTITQADIGSVVNNGASQKSRKKAFVSLQSTASSLRAAFKLTWQALAFGGVKKTSQL